MKSWFRSYPMPQNKRPLLIGITGNIGSGKSSLARIISEQGHTVVSADQVAKDQLELPEVRQRLVERWGEKILSAEKPDPAKISAIVFKQPTELAFLNSLIHPRVLKEFSRLCASGAAKILFFEVPLLFEAGLQEGFDFIILITTGAYTREQRLLARDQSSPEAIRERLAMQLDDKDKHSRVDLVIHNDSSLDVLRKRALRFLAGIESIPFKKVRPFHKLLKQS